MSVQHTQNYWGNHVNDPEAVAKSIEYDCPYGWAEYKAQFKNDPDTVTEVCTAVSIWFLILLSLRRLH